ncbi:MAG: MOSC domain-containing protein [Paracoccaceae bacterium]|jgi:MOSC domain-containing protein YiiM
MVALEPTEFYGKVTFLGHVQDREAGLSSAQLDHMQLSFAGSQNEDHGGETRPSCSRVLKQYDRGTPIRNVRQLSILSVEEIAQIAQTMGIDHLDPTVFGASLVIEGIPDLTLVPPSSRLQFASGATVTVDMENHPCHLVSREIEAIYPGKGKLFKPAAQRRRGVTAWVEAEGAISIGDSVRLHIPTQPAWPHLTDTLSQIG